jgi:predicted DNA-binding transcriptional regulator YafY
MGASGGYRLAAGGSMPPLLLDDDEAIAITVGLRVAASHPVDGIEDASVRALAKVLQVLPTRLRHRVGALGAASPVVLAGDGTVVDPDDLTILSAAVANQERVRFDYDAADGSHGDCTLPWRSPRPVSGTASAI